MDKLNQPNRPVQQGLVSETSYNKPLQQNVRPVRPVRPGQNATNKLGNNAGQHIQMQSAQNISRQQQHIEAIPKQNQQQVNKQNNSNKQSLNQQHNFSQGVNCKQPDNQYTQQCYNNKQDNSSLAKRQKLTRLQRESKGLPSRNNVEQQYVGNKELCQRNDFELNNSNANSFKVRHVKQEGIGFLLLPLSLLILLVVIMLILLGNVLLSIDELKVNTTSLLNSQPISREEFIEEAEKINLQIDNKELGGGINEVMAYKEDYSYEINYITFEYSEETKAYYNYIIDVADESESSVSSSIVGQNSAESTLISETYNGFMDITYIDNTIIIAIAYDSNKQTEVIEFMNNLGY